MWLLDKPVSDKSDVTAFICTTVTLRINVTVKNVNLIT